MASLQEEGLVDPSSSKSSKKQAATFVCEICRSKGLEARYSRIEYLHRHERTHSETKPFKCEFCDKSYARSDVLFRHRRKCGQHAAGGALNPNSEESELEPARSGLEIGVDGTYLPPRVARSARTDARPYPTLAEPSDIHSKRARNPHPSKTITSTKSNLTATSNSLLAPPDYDISSSSEPGALSTGSSPSSSGSSNSPQTSLAGLGPVSNTACTSPPDWLKPPEPAYANLSQLLSAVPGGFADVYAPESDPFSLLYQPNGPLTSDIAEAYLDPEQTALLQSDISNGNWVYNQDASNGFHQGPVPWSIAARRYNLAEKLLVPEQTMLASEYELFRQRSGVQRLARSHPFFFEPDRLMYCYMIEKWNMPPALKMSALASRTYNSVLEHLGVFHMPTFHLNEAHLWVIFAMCTTAPRPEQVLRKAGPREDVGITPELRRALSDLDNDADWARSQDNIRREKTELLVKTFYQTSKGKRMTAEEALPLIHALLLYNSTSFLSENRTERLAGELYLATITSVARQSGLFHPGGDCTTPGQAPTKDWDFHWRNWITMESWRRTAWLVYTLDSLAALESDSVAHIEPKDIRHIPLPYSNALWKATTAHDWAHAMMTLHDAGITLDQGMYSMVIQPYSADPNPFYRRQCGPYARHILVLTILRGLVSYGQGQPRGGYVTRRWILTTKDGQTRCPSTDKLEMHRYIIATYAKMLDNWRQGWDLDTYCHPNYRGMFFVNDALPTYWLSRAILDHITPPPPAHVPSLTHVYPFAETETTPPSLLSQQQQQYSTPLPRGAAPAISIKPPTPEDEFDSDGPNRLVGTNLKEMLSMARKFVENGEGLGIPLSTSDPNHTNESTVDINPLDDIIIGGSNDPRDPMNYVPPGVDPAFDVPIGELLPDPYAAIFRMR